MTRISDDAATLSGMSLPQAVLAAVQRAIPRFAKGAALHEPEFAGREWEYVKECIDTGWVSSAGKFVERFEHLLAEQTGAVHAVATVNGTAALHVALLLAGVQPGDEVLIPTLTFIATANAVSYACATPHFVDSDDRTLGIDVDKLDRYLRDVAIVRDGRCVNRKTGAVIRVLMPMHTFGLVGDIEGLLALCERWSLVLVEDAAESLGTRYKECHTGTFGRLGALSFNGNKVVTTGGGGAILTDDADLAKHAKHLTTTARIAHHWSFIHDQVGFNYRLPNINAALGCAQLERLEDFLQRKRELQRRYVRAFAGVRGIAVLSESAECRSNYWLVTLMLGRPDLTMRDQVLQALNTAGFMARPVWTLMHRLPMYAACPRMDLATAEALDHRIVNVPSSPKLVD